jgi:hypothetical protein
MKQTQFQIYHLTTCKNLLGRQLLTTIFIAMRAREARKARVQRRMKNDTHLGSQNPPRGEFEKYFWRRGKMDSLERRRKEKIKSPFWLGGLGVGTRPFKLSLAGLQRQERLGKGVPFFREP